MTTHRIVSHEEWIAARKALLQKEKQLTQARDGLAEARQALPWEKVEKKYVFDGPQGEETLSDLFGGCTQLVIYHFMLGPDATVGCKACSFWADNFERNVVHLAHRDVTMLAVSRGLLDRIEAFKRRMGWTFKWVSSGRSEFNFDFGVSFPDADDGHATYNYGPKSFGSTEMPGVSVFYREPDGAVYHTYSTYARGLDMLNAAYQYLDLVPKGRDEKSLPFTMTWLRHRDEYDVAS